jgi:mannosyltransferase OCH1-like enzyme
MIWIHGLTALVFLIALCMLLLSGRQAESFEIKEGFLEDEQSISVTDLRLSLVSDTWTTDTVPLILHQLAPKEKQSWHHIWEKCQATWYEKFPNCSYRMWHDEDIDNLIYEKFPAFMRIYKNYPKNIHRFDIVRYFILYEYGGIYADMDMECVNNFYDLLPVGKVSVAESAIPGEMFQNALMASPARHPYWHYILNECIAYRNVEDVLQATGPNVIARVANVVPPNMFNALPSEQFSVESYPQTEQVFRRSMRTDIFSIHHGSCVYCIRP